MSADQIQAFVLLSKSDNTLMERLKAAADIDSVVEIAKEAGFAVTKEELELMKANSQNSETLSDAELDTVAGGALGCWWNFLGFYSGIN